MVCAWHTQVGFSGTEMGLLSDDNRSFATAVVPAIRTIAYGKAAKLGAWLAEAICRNNRYALRDARSGEGT